MTLKNQDDDVRWRRDNRLIYPQKFDVLDVAIVGVFFVQGVLEQASRNLALIAQIMQAAANHGRDVSEFKGSVERGLDQLS